MKLVLIIAALLVASRAFAQQTRFYDARGNSVGTATRDSQGTTTFRDSRGNVTGRASIGTLCPNPNARCLARDNPGGFFGRSSR